MRLCNVIGRMPGLYSKEREPHKSREECTFWDLSGKFAELCREKEKEFF